MRAQEGRGPGASALGASPTNVSAHAFDDKRSAVNTGRRSTPVTAMFRRQPILLLTLCFFCEQQASARLTVDDFFPFGVGNGDNLLPDGDDTVANVPFPTEFFFFDRAYTFFGVSAYKI